MQEITLYSQANKEQLKRSKALSFQLCNLARLLTEFGPREEVHAIDQINGT